MEFLLEHPWLAQTPSFSADLHVSLRQEMEELLSWGRQAHERTMGVSSSTLSDLSFPPSDVTADLQLEECVSNLREVLGPLIEHDQLVQVALAADYNVNRALNFFFGGKATTEETD